MANHLGHLSVNRTVRKQETKRPTKPFFFFFRSFAVTFLPCHPTSVRHSSSQPGQTQPKVSLILPPNPTYPTHDIPTEYDLVLAPSPVEAEEEERGTSSGLNGAKRQGFVLKEGEQRVEGRRQSFPPFSSILSFLAFILRFPKTHFHVQRFLFFYFSFLDTLES